ncbi:MULTISPECIES: oxidoreductase [Tatumella]|uniref:oxidoreductase n=1 Tax=Tatumella TaxID=82986 RepID=UPI0004708C64|nr:MULTISPECIES: oxidoreductase [Tatumella]
MPFTEIQVVPGPANYYCFPGALRELENFYSAADLEQAFWIYGERAIAATESFLPAAWSLPSAGKHCIREHCSEPLISQLLAQAGDHRKVIIGIGGGSVMDSAKALADRLKLPVVLIPTIAATCAAWTPLSVWYNAHGENIGYEIFKQSNHLVLVEPEIILNAPADYLLAGIGDTLAKWYEARVLLPDETASSVPYLAKTALKMAEGLRDLLFSDSAAALRDQQQGTLTPRFISVVDAIIAGGGLIGGLGERFTRVAAAHAVHNGLTVLPQTHRILHGIKVAYGILVQSALLNQQQDIRKLLHFYHQLKLPVTLAELGVSLSDREEMDKVIAHTLRPRETIHLLPVEVTAETLYQAMAAIERAGKSAE